MRPAVRACRSRSRTGSAARRGRGGPRYPGAAARAGPRAPRCRPAPSRDLVDGVAEVVQGERVGAAVPAAVPVSPVAASTSPPTQPRHVRRRRSCGCRRRPWRGAASGTGPRGRTRQRPPPARPTVRPRAPRAAQQRLGGPRDAAQLPERRGDQDQLAGLHRLPAGEVLLETGQVQAGAAGAERPGRWPGAASCSRISTSRSSSGSAPRSANSTLPRLAGTTLGRSTTRATGRVSPAMAARRTAEAVRVSSPAIAKQA